MEIDLRTGSDGAGTGVDRVWVFVDYQNTYMSARSIFYDGEGPASCGQIDPGGLGRLLVDRSPFERQLVGVSVYRGLPSPDRNLNGYLSTDRQNKGWECDPLVNVITTQLRYHTDHREGQEKGVDVSLAVDLVLGAASGRFDVGIVVSLDTDLCPALDRVHNVLHGVRVEVAAFRRPESPEHRLSLPGTDLWCHWIEPAEFWRITDDHDYTVTNGGRRAG